MKLGYTIAGVTDAPTVAISGATWLTADGGAACIDGAPARRARMSGGGTVTLTFPQAFPVGVCAALGLKNVALGATITAAGSSGTVRRMPDGSLGCWILLAASVNTSSVAFAIPGAGAIDIGELVAMPVVDVVHASDVDDAYDDATRFERTRSSQLNAVASSAYRVYEIPLAPADVSIYRGGVLANGMDWLSIRRALAGGRRCCVITRSNDAASIAQTALYGVGSLQVVHHDGGDYYSGSSTFQEIPG